MYANQTRIDPETGIEFSPENSNMEPRIRAQGGLDGAAALWGRTVPLWNPLIEALSALGYSPKNIFMQSYDWHLSLEALESRDGYFTNLKYVIESAYHQNDNRKVVLVCHSLGGVIFTWFSQFITAHDASWMDKYVHANVLLGAPLLGAPKAINALLSGDIPDLQGAFSFLHKTEIINHGNEFMSRFTEIMRNLESLMYLLPKGGDDFWASYAWAQQSNVSDLSRLLQNSQKMNVVLESDLCADLNSNLDQRTIDSVFGNFTQIYKDRKPMFLDCSGRKQHKSISEAIDFLHSDIESMHSKGGSRANVTNVMRRLQGLCQNGILCTNEFTLLPSVINFILFDTRAGRHKNGSLSRESSWCNPLLNPLPQAPSMSIYCFGSRAHDNTEIAYLMKDERQSNQLCSDKWSRPISTIIRNALGHNLLETTSGDGTIPWLSQTLMCSDEEMYGLRGWNGNSELNPGKVQASDVVLQFFSFCLMFHSQTEVVELELEPASDIDSLHAWVRLAHRYVSNVIYSAFLSSSSYFLDSNAFAVVALAQCARHERNGRPCLDDSK